MNFTKTSADMPQGASKRARKRARKGAWGSARARARKKDTRAYECPSTFMKERREERLHPPSFERRGPWGMLEPPLLPRGGEGSQKKKERGVRNR